MIKSKNGYIAKMAADLSSRPTFTFPLRDFILAGHAVFTVRSKKTGTRFTYKIRQPEPETDGAPAPHFVSVLTGPDNESDYQYLGCIFQARDFVVTKKSRIGKDAPSAKAFAWLWAQLMAGKDVTGQMEYWHEGTCCRCGRRLTTPESIEAGIGPVCAGRM